MHTNASPTVDLLALIGADTTLKRVSGTRGGEYAGPCPQCGGTDRLHVQPVAGYWMCRAHHPRWTDAAGYLMDRDGLRYPEAVAQLENRIVETTRIPQQPAERPDEPPASDWQAQASTIIAECAAALWGDQGKPARQFLAKRGIKRPTAEAARLGYNPTARRLAGLWVEAGVVIPWCADGAVWQLKIRRSANAAGEHYVSVAGGHPWLYLGDTVAGARTVVLCEGEFDALLLRQEAGDLAAVATLGSASAAFTQRTAARLLGAERILVAYDADEAGDRGADKLIAQSRRCRRIVVPEGKDITEFFQAGGRLRDWLQIAIERHAAPATDDVPRCTVEGCTDELDRYLPDGTAVCEQHALSAVA